jgi:hypothetical protein
MLQYGQGMIKSRRMTRTGYAAGIGRKGMLIGFWREARRKETTRKTLT